uniref:Putative polyprotein n=1 Tax=Marsac virus TaxID=1807804 RepID=A0A140HEP8_9VIRU|nr:putative polyprotein [Marsac virus]
MGTTFDHSDFVSGIEAIFGSAVNTGTRDQILLNFLNSKTDNVLKQVFADHYKQLYDSYKFSKRFTRDVSISTTLTTDERKQLTDAYPGLRIQFTNEDKNAHAYAKASRVLEFYNILYQRIRISEDANVEKLLQSNCWDAMVKDCGGDPTSLLKPNTKYLHVCAPNIGDDSYDSVRYTHRITSLINRSTSDRDFHKRSTSLLDDIQSNRTTQSLCSKKGQDCTIRAPFIMFVHSIYDMTLTDIADAMDNANALVGYATIIYSDEILINTSGDMKPLNVWWKYSDTLDSYQWNPEMVLNHVTGTITFGFNDDDGFNYTHSLANYKSFFTTSRFKSSIGNYYSLELQENRDGIQFIRFTRELKASSKGVTHTLNLRSLECKYLVSMYDVAPDYSFQKIKPTAYRSTMTPWLSNNSSRLIPHRFVAERDPVDKTINYLSSVKANLKPNECLNYLRNYCTRSIHNGSVMDQRLNLNETQIKLLSNALYLNVYDSNYRSGKIVQQAVNDLDVARNFSYFNYRRLFGVTDYLNITESWFSETLRKYALYINTSDNSNVKLFRTVLRYSSYIVASCTFIYAAKKIYRLSLTIPVYGTPRVGFFARHFYALSKSITESLNNYLSPLNAHERWRLPLYKCLLHILPSPSPWWSQPKNFSRLIHDRIIRIDNNLIFLKLSRPFIRFALNLMPKQSSINWTPIPKVFSLGFSLSLATVISVCAKNATAFITTPILLDSTSHFINTRDMIRAPVTKYTYVEKQMSHLGVDYAIFVPSDFCDDDRTVFAKAMIKSIYDVDVDSDELTPVIEHKIKSRTTKTGAQLERDRLSALTAIPQFDEIKNSLFPRHTIGAIDKLLSLIEQHPFLKATKNQSILEIGAAPGSWTKHLISLPFHKYTIINPSGYPHLPMSDDVLTLINSADNVLLIDEEIQNYQTENKFDIIYSDAAGPASDYEAQSQIHDELYVSIIRFCVSHLNDGGSFVMKIFDLTPVLSDAIRSIESTFKSTSLIKPDGSKPLNPECYLVAEGYSLSVEKHTVETDYQSILNDQTTSLVAFVTEANKFKPEESFIDIDVIADGNCCFYSATLNRILDISAFKEEIRPILVARNPDLPDLNHELEKGEWGGSAFLQAFGEYTGVRYIIHESDGRYTFGADTTRIVHLKRTVRPDHYSILLNKHCGTEDRFELTSFPSFRTHEVIQSLSKYINVGSPSSKYVYSGNMDHFCNLHQECRNNAFAYTLGSINNKDCAMFFIERRSGHLSINNIIATLRKYDLHMRVHALHLPDHYVVSTHTGYSDLPTDIFERVDKHFSTCSCGKLHFRSDSIRTENGLVYYCKRAVISPSTTVGTYDLLVELKNMCSVDVTPKLELVNRHLTVPITVSEAQRVTTRPTHDEIVHVLQQNYDNSVNDVVIKTPIVDPLFVVTAITAVYNRAQIHYENCTGGIIRLKQVPLIETGIPSIIVNTMMERRDLWNHTIEFTRITLKRYHDDMIRAHSFGRPLDCNDTGFHLFKVDSGIVLAGTGINTDDVRWGWDGKELINFDALTTTCVRQATDSQFISFNKHSVLLQSYHHYQRTKSVNIDDIVLDCQFNPILGIPGGGKTEYILRNCKSPTHSTLILTVSKAAKTDIQSRALAVGLDHNVAICTFDSFMINYERCHSKVNYNTIWFDEARLTHAGDWLWAAYLTKCKNMFIVGDVAQIPYCERTDYIVRYSSPNIFTIPSHNLSVSHRCPQDILRWMRISRNNRNEPFYDFQISSVSKITHSVSCQSIPNINAVPRVNNAQYLVYTQSELRDMIKAGFSHCRTVHQYQGNQNKHVILVRLEQKDAIPVYKSMSHMLVAFTRHTNRFDYYTCCPVEKDLVYNNVFTIRNFSDNDIKSRAGGYHHNPEIEIEMPCTQQPHLYPKLTRDLNDKYGFGAIIPMKMRKVLPPIDIVEHATLSFDPLIGHQHIIRQYIDTLYHVPSGIENISDHNIYTISDKQFFGEYSMIPSAKVTKDRTYATPIISSSSRLRNPIDQYQIAKAYCERNGAVPEIRGNIDSCSMADMLINTVKSLLDPALLSLCTANPISANNNSITTWLARQPVAVRNQISSDPDTIDDKDLTRYMFTIKGNAKPDLDSNPHARYKSAQTIAYQDKSINAIFCPIMADFTERLVALLNSNIVLFNRLSNVDYTSLVDLICPYERFRKLNRFFEIDFSKFDKSQDQTALEFECKLMSLLGVSTEYVSRWYRMHVKTTLVDINNRFSANVEYQRKSGDAGTWVLNTVFQMAVVINAMRLETEILAGRCFATFSGDDSLVFIEDLLPIDIDHVSTTCANIFNLEVKLLNFRTPYFCSKFFLPTPRGVLFIPDVIKTLVKLGRRDLISIEHAKEYYISFKDNNEPLLDAYQWPSISACISDRYALPGDHTILVHAIATITSDETSFLSLWDYTDTSDSKNRPSLDL